MCLLACVNFPEEGNRAASEQQDQHKIPQSRGPCGPGEGHGRAVQRAAALSEDNVVVEPSAG
jgi:hypothetical protein